MDRIKAKDILLKSQIELIEVKRLRDRARKPIRKEIYRVQLIRLDERIKTLKWVLGDE